MPQIPIVAAPSQFTAIKPIPLVLYNPDVINLLDFAPKARWCTGILTDANNTTNDSTIPWMGDFAHDTQKSGSVLMDDLVLEDKKTYHALRTHPKWTTGNGTIKGYMPWILQKGVGTFSAQLGFGLGADATDGVTFQVWVHYKNAQGKENSEKIIQQYKKYDGTLISVSAELTKWSNEEIAIELRVDAGATPNYDWACWVNPIIKLEAENTPVVAGTDTPVLFNDRSNDNIKWYLPLYEIIQPLTPFFSINGSKLSADGQTKLFDGDVTLELQETVSPEVHKIFDEVKNTNAAAELKKIDVINLTTRLTLYNNGSGGRTKITDIFGKFISPNKVQFHLTDLAELSVLKFAYRNFADPDNTADEFATITVTGNYMAARKSPVLRQVLNPDKMNEDMRTRPLPFFSRKMLSNFITENTTYTYQKEIKTFDCPANCSIPCNSRNGSLYVQTQKVNNQNVQTPVACMPPWKKETNGGNLYHKIILKGQYSIKTDVYQSYAQPDIFVLCPRQYYIARDKAENGCKPLVEMISLMDPNEEYANHLTIRFSILHTISDYELALITSELYTLTQTMNGSNVTPVIKFPSDIGINPVPDYSKLIAGTYKIENLNSQAYILDFMVGDPKEFSPADGAIAYRMLTDTQSQGLIHSLTFSLDENIANKTISTISLTLNKTAGSIINIAKDLVNNSIVISNLCESDLAVKNIAILKADKNVFKNYALGTKTLPAKNQVSIPVNQLVTFNAQDLINYPEITVDYERSENGVKIIKENNISIDCLQETIIITSNITASLHKLIKIKVEVSFLAANIHLVQDLHPVNDNFVNINTVPFNLLLPLNIYKDDISKTMNYQLTFYFEGELKANINPKSSAIFSQNFGTNPTIDIPLTIFDTVK